MPSCVNGQCYVYVLFGKVLPRWTSRDCTYWWAKLGLAAFIVNWVGRCHDLDMRLDQEYLRSQPVNSEEGAPMGIGIWHEMYISDPVAYLFKNTDPRGSLSANVSSSTVRCLSNMPLAAMMTNRHAMSETVRDRSFAEVPRMGLSARLGVYPQSAFPRCRDDPPDRKQGGQPLAPGDIRDQTGRCEPSEHHHQHGGKPGGGGVCQSRGYPPANCGRGTTNHSKIPTWSPRCLRFWKPRRSHTVAAALPCCLRRAACSLNCYPRENRRDSHRCYPRHNPGPIEHANPGFPPRSRITLAKVVQGVCTGRNFGLPSRPGETPAPFSAFVLRRALHHRAWPITSRRHGHLPSPRC